MQTKLIEDRATSVGPAVERLNLTHDPDAQAATIDLEYFDQSGGGDPRTLIARSFTTLPWRVMKEIADVVNQSEKEGSTA